MIKAYLLMGVEDLTPALSVRQTVFVDEQGFNAASERDEMDARALHAVVEDGAPCATGRLYYDRDAWHIGRVAVLKEKRGQHLGDLVMRMLLDQALKLGASSIQIGAQTHAVDFYKKYGFEPCGASYLEEDCPHIPMSASRARIESMVFAGCGGDCANCKSACGTGAGQSKDA